MSNNIFAQIESALFCFGEAMEIAKLASLLNISHEECEKALREWTTTLANDAARGLVVLRKENKIQLVTKPELQSIGEAIMKDEFREELSPAALETLSLIAYLGPVPRATIDYVRGVNSSFTLRALVMRGLVERCEEKGLSFCYRATEQFLKHMGLASIQELPEYPKYKEILHQFEEQLQSIATNNNPVQAPQKTEPAAQEE